MANQVREAMERLNKSIEGRKPATRRERAMVEAAESITRPLEPMPDRGEDAQLRLQTAADGLIVRMHIAISEFATVLKTVNAYVESCIPVPPSIMEEAERAERELDYVNEMASRHVARLY